MTLPVTEIAIFPTSEAYRASTAVLNEGLGGLSKVDGVQRSFHGLQVEDSKHGYAFNVWDTLEHHTSLIKSEAYGPLIQSMLPAFIGSIQILHVQFTPPELQALSHPITEVTFLKPKSSDDRDSVLKTLAELSAKSGGTLSYGNAIEEEDTVIIIRGRPSTAAEEEPILAALHPLASTVDVKHVTLTHYKVEDS